MDTVAITPRRLVTDDRGSASLAVVLTAPIMVVLMFAGFQAALWNHSRTEVRVVAREAAILVARDGVSTATAGSIATATLNRDGLLQAVRVTVTRGSQVVTVVITGKAPGVLRGTYRAVRVVVNVSLEGWVPL